MARYDLTKEKERLDKVRDADLIAADRVYAIADWLQVLGWFALIIGVLVAIANDGGPYASTVVVGGFSAVIAARFVRAFAVLVETSAQNKRFNWQTVVELRRLQQMLAQPVRQEDWPPEDDQPQDAKQRVEDVFDKYPAE